MAKRNSPLQLFPKPPKRMKQPRKDHFRWRAEIAEAQLAYTSTPWWWRLWHRVDARIRERDAPGDWLELPSFLRRNTGEQTP